MNAYQPVLDPACGGRMFWFDKSDSRVLFGDVRDESWELCDGRRFEVRPDMLMDYRDLPFPDETFRMVVLDPDRTAIASFVLQEDGAAGGRVTPFRLLDDDGLGLPASERERLWVEYCTATTRRRCFTWSHGADA